MSAYLSKIRLGRQDPPKLIDVIYSSGIGYLACRFFTSINPASAAIFNTAAKITHSFVSKMFKNLKFNNTNKFIINAGSVLIISYFITNYFAKFTLIEGIKVSVLTIITKIALNFLFGPLFTITLF